MPRVTLSIGAITPLNMNGKIPSTTPQIEVQITTSDPTLPHWAEVFFDLDHTLPVSDTVPDTSRGNVYFPAGSTGATTSFARLKPPPVPAPVGRKYILTVWVDGDINKRYLGQATDNDIAEKFVYVDQIIDPPKGTPPLPPA